MCGQRLAYGCSFNAVSGWSGSVAEQSMANGSATVFVSTKDNAVGDAVAINRVFGSCTPCAV